MFLTLKTEVAGLRLSREVSGDYILTFQLVIRPLVVIGTLLVAYKYCFAAPDTLMKFASVSSTYCLVASYWACVTLTLLYTTGTFALIAVCVATYTSTPCAVVVTESLAVST